MTRYTEGFSNFVTSMTAPVLPAGAMAGWGLHPLEKRRLTTAHTLSRHLVKPTSRKVISLSVCGAKRPHFRRRKLNTRPGPDCGVQVVSQRHYVTFQLAEVAVPRGLFPEILRLIYGLRPAPLLPGRSLIQPE